MLRRPLAPTHIFIFEQHLLKQYYFYILLYINDYIWTLLNIMHRFLPCKVNKSAFNLICIFRQIHENLDLKSNKLRKLSVVLWSSVKRASLPRPGLIAFFSKQRFSSQWKSIGSKNLTLAMLFFRPICVQIRKIFFRFYSTMRTNLRLPAAIFR